MGKLLKDDILASSPAPRGLTREGQGRAGCWMNKSGLRYQWVTWGQLSLCRTAP